MKSKKIITQGIIAVAAICIMGCMTSCSYRKQAVEAPGAVEEDNPAVVPEEYAIAVEPEEQIEVIKTAEETAVDEEIASGMEEPDMTPETEPAEEDYYYTALLKAMIKEPTIFWERWETIENMNIPENNRFAVVDIDSDGVKELLVEHDITSVRDGIYRAVDIYTEDMVYERLGDKLEFYADGTIVDHDQFRVDYDQYSDFQYITFYKDYDVIANMYTWDKDRTEELIKIVNGEFPEDKDSDHDGRIYVWQDFSKNELGTYDTVESYFTEEEFHAKMEEMLEDKEKIEIPWQNIRESNLIQANGEDAQILASMPTILGYVYAKAILELPVSVCDYLSIYHFEYYFINKSVEYSEDDYRNLFRDILPSAQWLFRDEDSYSTFRVDFSDISTLSKEGFGEDITINDFVEDGGWYVTDLGDGTVNLCFDEKGMHDEYDTQILRVERTEDKITIEGICNTYIESSALNIMRFTCTLQKNINSPLDGYTIIDFTEMKYPRIS